MCGAYKSWGRRSIRRILVGGLVFFAAWHAVDPARGQSPPAAASAQAAGASAPAASSVPKVPALANQPPNPCSCYSVATPSVTIWYQTYFNPYTQKIQIVPPCTPNPCPPTGGSMAGAGGSTLTITGGAATINGGETSIAGGQVSIKGASVKVSGASSSIRVDNTRIRGGNLTITSGDATIVGGTLKVSGGLLTTNGGITTITGGTATITGGTTTFRDVTVTIEGGAVRLGANASNPNTGTLSLADSRVSIPNSTITIAGGTLTITGSPVIRDGTVTINPSNATVSNGTATITGDRATIHTAILFARMTAGHVVFGHALALVSEYSATWPLPGMEEEPWPVPITGPPTPAPPAQLPPPAGNGSAKTSGAQPKEPGQDVTKDPNPPQAMASPDTLKIQWDPSYGCGPDYIDVEIHISYRQRKGVYTATKVPRSGDSYSVSLKALGDDVMKQILLTNCYDLCGTIELDGPAEVLVYPYCPPGPGDSSQAGGTAPDPNLQRSSTPAKTMNSLQILIQAKSFTGSL